MLAYLSVALTALAGLTLMIVMIARALADCPDMAPRAKAAGITIATGYFAIGGGAVLLIGAFVTLDPEFTTAIFCMGLACLVLGLGFTQAVTTLRAVLTDAPPAPCNPWPEGGPVPMEPILP